MISLILVLLFTKLIFRDYYFYGGYGCHDCYNPKLSIETHIEGDNNKVDVSVSLGSNNVCIYVRVWVRKPTCLCSIKYVNVYHIRGGGIQVLQRNLHRPNQTR